MSSMPDSQRRQEAIDRLKKRSEFGAHLVTYLLVNALLVTVWVAAGADGLFWPLFPMFAWGIGLVFHAWDTFRPPLSEERIRREIARMERSRTAR